MPLPDSLASLTEIPLSARELRFSADFPGRIARLTDGRCDYIVRLVSQPEQVDAIRPIGHKSARLREVPDVINRRQMTRRRVISDLF